MASATGTVVDVRSGQASKEFGYIDPDEKIVKLTIRSCRLLHGSYSWAATFFKNVVTLGQADPLEHWWVVLETNRGKFYCAQFYPYDCYTLEHCGSFQSCDRHGLDCAQKDYDADIWTEESHSGRLKLRSMVDWMKSKEFSPKYSLTTHNCQDLAKTMRSYFKRNAQ